VRAVLDWEFTFAGSPLVDLGNALRFTEDETPAYAEGLVAGFAAAGGSLPPGWRRQAELLDGFALLELLEGGRPHVGVYDAVVARARRRFGQRT
jgi:fructokinase